MRITGLYDLRTVHLLRENKIDSLGFDLRPRSLNFIQGYRLAEIASELVGGKLFLHFENEKEFVIKNVLKDIRDVFNGEIILEFSDIQATEYYDQFECPYILFYTHSRDLKDSCGSFFKGFVFDYKDLETIHERGQFDTWLRQYYLKTAFLKEQPLHLLNQSWHSSLFPSLQDFLDLDFIGLPICSDVEVCFRNVDLKLFKEQVDYVKRQNI